MTTNLAETIAGLEQLQKWHAYERDNGMKTDAEIGHHRVSIRVLESALTHLRSQEETVRRCEQAIEKLSEELYAEHGNVDPETGANELPTRYMDIAEAYDSCKAAILAAHGLKEKP